MSRIDEALKRLTGAHRDARPPSTLDRYAAEKAPRRDDGRVTSFVTTGPQRVEPRPAAVSAPAPAPAAPLPERRHPVLTAAPVMQEPAETSGESEQKPEEERLVD